MSEFDEDLSESMAAELTGSVGLSDQPQDGDEISQNLADDLELFERHAAEKDIPVNNDVDDTREAVEQREAEQAQVQKRGQKVPLAALHEERTKRQALETEAQQLRQQLAQFQQQSQQAQQAQLQQQQAAEIPDFDEDPRGHIEAVKHQFKQEIESLKNGRVQQPQFHQVEAQVMQEAAVLAPAIADAEARFEAANPDYRQAFDHVLAAAERNMVAAHPGINEQQLGMLRTAAFVELAKQCQQQGRNVAEHIYSRAQAMGYQPARAPRQANTSLSNVHGSPRAPDEQGRLSVSQISDMSEKEFDALWNDMKRGAAVGPAF